MNGPADNGSDGDTGVADPPVAAHAARDTLYAGDDAAPSPPFRFDADVVRVFPDMLDRSIPGYATIVAQTGLLATRFARAGTRLYDLGCSLGASALAMRAALARPRAAASSERPARTIDTAPDAASADCEIHAIDDSSAMIARARELVAENARATPADLVAPPVVLHEEDLLAHAFAPASLVAMNFTLQFVAPSERESLLGRIARALVPGGALILSEKLRFDDPVLEALHVDMHHAFKRANGYSALEIARKRAALEAVLVPDTLETHRARLAHAGFARTSVWFQCFNFVSLVAIRD